MLEIQEIPKFLFLGGDILLIVGSMYLLSINTNKISFQVSYPLNTFKFKIFHLIQRQMKYLLL